MLVMLVVQLVMVMVMVMVPASARSRSSAHAAVHQPQRLAPDPEGQRHAVLGCALCIAVADRINSSLVEAHEALSRRENSTRRRLNNGSVSTDSADARNNITLPSLENSTRPRGHDDNVTAVSADTCNNDTLSSRENTTRRRLRDDEVSTALADACNKGFQGYELWPPPPTEDPEGKFSAVREQVQNFTRRTPPIFWTERLRKQCAWYLQETGQEELYRQWRGMLSFPAQRLDLFLCMNSGWLRACANLPEEDLPTMHLRKIEEIVTTTPPKSFIFSIGRFRLICTPLFCWSH